MPNDLYQLSYDEISAELVYNRKIREKQQMSSEKLKKFYKGFFCHKG